MQINFICELINVSSAIKLLILRSNRKIYVHKFNPVKDGYGKMDLYFVKF